MLCMPVPGNCKALNGKENIPELSSKDSMQKLDFFRNSINYFLSITVISSKTGSIH